MPTPHLRTAPATATPRTPEQAEEPEVESGEPPVDETDNGPPMAPGDIGED